MEKLPSKDIERMMTFINHEADEKIREMRIKAIQEYNTEKARIIKEETAKAENEFVLRQKEIEKKRVMAENSLINSYKQEYLKEKAGILNEIYREVLEQCSKKPLSPSLIAQCVEKIDGDFIVYCSERDMETVRRLYKDVEVRRMVDGGMGGVMLCSVDHDTIVDNSFASRVETVKETFEAGIGRVIFSGLVEENK